MKNRKLSKQNKFSVRFKMNIKRVKIKINAVRVKSVI